MRVSLLVLAVSFAASGPLQADEREDQYLAIFNLIQQADHLSDSGKTNAALPKYQEALTALQKFRRSYPDFNAKMVTFRLNYLIAKVTPPPPPPPPPASSSAAPSSDPSSGSSEVKLLDAGAEPRKSLRLHPKPGDKQALEMTLKMEMKMGEMQNANMKLPALRIPMEATVEAVAADGEITFKTVMGEAGTVDEPGGNAQLAELLKAPLASLKGLSGGGTLSARGIAQNQELKLPAGMDPQMRQLMDQMKDAFSEFSIPLPEEEVGPGARWQVKKPVKAQGMTIQQDTNWELVSLEGERLVVKTVQTQSAANQKIQNAAMPGVKVDLAKMTGTSSGQLTQDLTQVLPSEGTIDSRSEMTMNMDMGGQKQTMAMKMEFNLRLYTK